MSEKPETPSDTGDLHGIIGVGGNVAICVAMLLLGYAYFRGAIGQTAMFLSLVAGLVLLVVWPYLWGDVADV